MSPSPSVPRTAAWILLLALSSLAGLGARTATISAAPAPERDLDQLDQALETAPVSPDHHPIVPIIYPRYPIIYPGFPIIIIPIFPYPHPCGGRGILPVPPPPGQPGLPTPGGTPGPTPTLRPVATPTPGGRAQSVQYRVCPQVTGLIPQDVQDLATGEPWRIQGYGQLQNPGVPYHPLWNSYRKWLSLRDTAQPYSLCNYPLWKAGCP